MMVNCGWWGPCCGAMTTANVWLPCVSDTLTWSQARPHRNPKAPTLMVRRIFTLWIPQLHRMSSDGCHTMSEIWSSNTGGEVPFDSENNPSCDCGTTRCYHNSHSCRRPRGWIDADEEIIAVVASYSLPLFTIWSLSMCQKESSSL